MSIMKINLSPCTAPQALRDSLFCFSLWVLAGGLPLAVLGQVSYLTPYTFTTLAGNTGIGSADGTNSAARFANPFGVALDTNGNVYSADYLNHTIRKVTPVGTNWVVTTLAGLAVSLAARTGRTVPRGLIILPAWRWIARATFM
jgi:hypothetical protein